MPVPALREAEDAVDAEGPEDDGAAENKGDGKAEEAERGVGRASIIYRASRACERELCAPIPCQVLIGRSLIAGRGSVDILIDR